MPSFSSSFYVIFNQPASRTTFVSVFRCHSFCFLFVDFFTGYYRQLVILFWPASNAHFAPTVTLASILQFVSFVEECLRECVGQIQVILASIGLLLEKFLWLDQVDPPFLALLLLRRRSLTRSGWAEWKKAGKSNKKEIPRLYSPPPPLPLPTSRVIFRTSFVVYHSHKPAISTATASNLVVRSRSLFVWKSRCVRGVCDHWKKICRP